MTVGDFLALDWDGEPDALIRPPALSPLIADPSFLFPEETPDGLWQLFAHSAWGIHRYDSPDGLSWTDRGVAVWHGMRPFVRRIDGLYHLLYEAYPPFLLVTTVLPRKPKWRSRIACRTSADLVRWSAPETLAGPDPAWARDGRWGSSLSNPCLAADDLSWRLYCSASLVRVPDCGFEEPRYIALAERPLSGGPRGPYRHRERPIIDPADDTLPGVMGAGSLKAIRLDDGWLGLQNKIYAGPDGRSRSAIFLLRSADGVSWELARDEPLVQPTEGWRSSHVYACDCRLREADGRWYLYFNARDGWYMTSGRERIGRIVSR